MNSVINALRQIYENLPLLIAAILAVVGIVLRIKKFMKLDKEEQKRILFEQADRALELLKMQLLALVSKAEKEWGGGTGSIKKSWVWEQIGVQFDRLTELIEAGVIDKQVVDDLIESAVTELTNQRGKNAKIAAAVEKEGANTND